MLIIMRCLAEHLANQIRDPLHPVLAPVTSWFEFLNIFIDSNVLKRKKNNQIQYHKNHQFNTRRGVSLGPLAVLCDRPRDVGPAGASRAGSFNSGKNSGSHRDLDEPARERVE
jgi:hypothetical protein